MYVRVPEGRASDASWPRLFWTAHVLWAMTACSWTRLTIWRAPARSTRNSASLKFRRITTTPLPGRITSRSIYRQRRKGVAELFLRSSGLGLSQQRSGVTDFEFAWCFDVETVSYTHLTLP